MLSFRQYINGELVEGTGRTIAVECPGSNEVIGEFKSASAAQAQQALEAARDAFPAWSKLTLEQRGEWMLKLAEALMAEREKLAEIMALETGKFYNQSYMEVGGLERSLNFFLDQAKSNFRRDDSRPDGAELASLDPRAARSGGRLYRLELSHGQPVHEARRGAGLGLHGGYQARHPNPALDVAHRRDHEPHRLSPPASSIFWPAAPVI